MSKFKVGDKVYRLEDRKEADILWEVSAIKVMKGGDKEHYNYILKAEGDFSAGAKYKHAFLNFEEDLELYKTPHERLLDLGWIFESDDEDLIVYRFLQMDYYFYIKINKKTRKINLHDISDFGYTTTTDLDLELAEVLVDYLKELSFR